MPIRIPQLAVSLLAVSLCSACSWFRPDPPTYDTVREESGLVWRDLAVPNDGPAVDEDDDVAVHYDLRLADGTPVESSTDAGEPARFRVGDGTVPLGLDRGVRGMRLFGRRRLAVPSELAFGSEGRPPQIPPDADVVFDVELMEHAPR